MNRDHSVQRHTTALNSRDEYAPQEFNNKSSVRHWIMKNSTLFSTTATASNGDHRRHHHPARKIIARNNRHMLFGVLLLAGSFLLFMLFSVSIMSKILMRFVPLFQSQQNVSASLLLSAAEAETAEVQGEETRNDDMIWVVQQVAEDWYYVLLIPLLAPVVVVFAYSNWLGMKFFRHSR